MLRLSRIIGASLFLASLSASAGGAMHPLSEDGGDGTAGRYAFLPGVFIDLNVGVEYGGPRGPTLVRPCHSENLNCLRGQLFEVAWSKDCRLYYVGQEWESGGIKTKVVSTFTKRIRHGTTIYFVGVTEGNDRSLYLFQNRRGLTGIVHDIAPEGRLADRAADEEFLARLSGGNRYLDHGMTISHYVGGGRFGTCDSTA